MQISHAQFSFNRSRMHLGILRQFLRIPQKCCGDDINDRCQDDDSLDDDDMEAIDALSLSEIYYLWVLAGGDIMSELRKNGLMVSLPPVLTMPSIMLNEGHPLGLVKERCVLYDQIVMVLPMNQLLSCLDDLTVEDAYPLLSDGED